MLFIFFSFHREFVSDKYKTVYTIQADNYPQQMINFIITQSQSLNLSTRLIKAVGYLFLDYKINYLLFI